MDRMWFVPLGVGDAFSALHYSTCLAVHREGYTLLVDCPHPIRKMLREAGLAAGIEIDAQQIDAVVLTHLHADHCCGLEDLAFYRSSIHGQKTHVVAHPRVSSELWSGHLESSMAPTRRAADGEFERRGFDTFFELSALSFDHPVAVGPFTIECRPTLHHLPTTALRIVTGGRTLGYSADTAHDPELIAWLAEADLLLHETNEGGHTPYDKLLELPADVRRRMRLVHYNDDFDTAASAIEPLRQGVRYSV